MAEAMFLVGIFAIFVVLGIAALEFGTDSREQFSDIRPTLS